MIDKDTILTLKQDHPEFFADRAAIFPGERGEQQIAQVLLQQIEHDKNHPPEAEQLSAVRRAIAHCNTKSAELARLRASVHDQVKALGANAAKLDIEILAAAPDGDASDFNRLLDEHRDQIAKQNERIQELEAFLDEQGKTLALAHERIKQLEAERDQLLGDLDALKGVNETHRIKLEKVEQELKTTQDALKAAEAKTAKKK